MDKYYYNISKIKAFENIESAKSSLLDNFQLDIQNSQLIIITNEASESEVLWKVLRECDRIYFLRDEQLDPQFQYYENSGGKKTCQQTITSDAKIVVPLSEKIDKQQWKGLVLSL